MSVADGPLEGMLVGIEAMQDLRKHCVGSFVRGFEIAIEFEQFGEEWEDEGKGDLAILLAIPIRRVQVGKSY